MGGSTSKVGRRLPTKARTSGHESQELGPAHSASRPQRPPPQASQAKSEGTPRAYSILHTIDNVQGQVSKEMEKTLIYSLI